MITRLLAGSAVLISPTQLMACAVCMGDANSQIAPATNGAIFFLLACIGAMLTGVGSFAFYLFRRSRLPHPPHEEFLNLNHQSAATGKL
jgi:hypothetical protein